MTTPPGSQYIDAASRLVPYGGDMEVPGSEGPADVGQLANAVPGVILLDTSWSMADVLATVAVAVNDFVRGLRRVPAVAEQAHIAIITFADTARTVLDFCRIADPRVVVSGLVPGGTGTNFRAAFDEVHRTLEDGLPRLARPGPDQRRAVMRPTVYFVSDGMPNVEADGWQASLGRLSQPRWRPNLFAFGFGAADRKVIGEIADPGCAYFADDGADPLGTLEQILRVILQSMVSISQGAVGGDTRSAAPPAGPGLVKIDPVL